MSDNDLNVLKPLLYLLDDPDEEVYSQVRGEVVNLGFSAVNALEIELNQSSDPLKINRIEQIIFEIEQADLVHKVADWSKEEHPILIDGIMMIEKSFNPNIDKQIIENKIDKIKLDVWIEMKHELTSYEKVKVINYIFFDIHKFKSIPKEDFKSKHTFLHQVLDSKQGNSLALSIIYSIIAQRLNIPIYGVNVPQYFLLGYMNNSEWQIPKNYNDKPVQHNFYGSEVVFYINAFNRGGIFPRQSVVQFLKQINVEPKEDYFRACTPQHVVLQYVKHLIKCYPHQSSRSKTRLLIRLEEVLTKK
jgi:hypothetical protein